VREPIAEPDALILQDPTLLHQVALFDGLEPDGYCYGVCPDNAVIKLEPTGSYQYEYDLDYCKGCGICAEECPCGAIEMVPEEI
jgi:MinD superfamily P-loop ATPase